MRCSPSATGSITGTCLQSSDIDVLKKTYNETHTDKVVDTSPTQILKTLKQKQSCQTDICAVNKLENATVRSTLLKTRYSPFMPMKWKENINEWLSSTDIINVLRQYEAKYPHFKFLGPSPTDYYFMETPTQCVWRDLCQFNLNAMIKAGKTKIGVVFNIDPHDLPGSHWVALFINTSLRRIHYFDSTGDEIHKDILRFVTEVQQQSRQIGPEYTFDLEKDQTYPLEHQYGNTECGMYVLYFIITLLRNQRDVYESMFKNPKRKIPDKAMERLRYEYFNERDAMKETPKMKVQLQQQYTKYNRLIAGKKQRKHFRTRKA